MNPVQDLNIIIPESQLAVQYSAIMVKRSVIELDLVQLMLL